MRYFQCRAEQTRSYNENLHLPDDWPGKSALEILVRRACGLFIWAATAWDFVHTAHYPPKRLQVLLEGKIDAKAETALDTLYRTALESAGDWDDEDFVKDFRTIMEIIIVARDPLSPPAIDRLLGLPKDQPSIHTVSCLGCVVAQTPVARILHPSFADFLFRDKIPCDKTWHRHWHFKAVSCHRHLAICCLQRLSNSLKRNICDLTLSANLENETLPEDVTYACLFWIDHVCLIKDDAREVLVKIRNFLEQHLEHWFEAMSVLRRSRDTIMLLNSLLKWFKVNSNGRDNLVKLVHDAFRFSQTFSTCLEEHPLLVYLAALPFAPINSSVYHASPHEPPIPTVAGGFQQYWSPARLILSKHQHAVNVAAFSHDGKRVVSGSWDKTIRVWDAMSGIQIPPVLTGHELAVTSVAFRRDGTLVVSGSLDRTVRVWDAQLGVEALPALRGHEGEVTSVTFSPNGNLIASGSWDKTIRLWDALSGVEILPALKGHEGEITSVAFSSDGTSIVSGSWDKTIRIWDTQSHIQKLPALRGHKRGVTSVAFAPNPNDNRSNNRIVSGSSDRTIRVWDALSGVEARPPLRGHDNEVTSVASSPNGTRIVSGSWDKSIRVWNTKSGVEVIPPLRGHDDDIMSVAFSPDGNSIISGSWDKSIRIWDILFRVKEMRKRGHEDSVQSVAFSSDGSCIVSTSSDNTIRVWDTQSGAETLPVIHGCESRITSATFSADGTRIVSHWLDNSIRIWVIPVHQSKYKLFYRFQSRGIKALPVLRGHKDKVTSVVFSSDGTRFVSGSWDRTIRVWDAESGFELFPPLRGHEGRIISVALSPDGTRVASGSEDKTVRVWDALSGTETLTALRGHGSEVVSVAFTPDSSRIVSSSLDNIIRIWDALSGFEVASVLDAHEDWVRPHLIKITDAGWLVDTLTNRTVSKLPAIFVPTSSAAHKNTLAVGTQGGQAVIIHFPSALFTSSETRCVEKNSRV